MRPLAVAVLLAAAAAAARPQLARALAWCLGRPTAPPGLPGRVALPLGWLRPALAGALLLGAVGLGALELRYRADLARLDRVAAAVTGVRGAHVRCQRWTATWLSAEGHAGLVRYDGPGGTPSTEAWLSYETCRDLRAWLHGDRARPTHAQVVAVHVLSHELRHVAGVTDEARAECLALQGDADVAERLGASSGQGEALAAAYARDVYPRMPDDYRSGACAPGGAWDLHPDTASWPTG